MVSEREEGITDEDGDGGVIEARVISINAGLSLLVGCESRMQEMRSNGSINLKIRIFEL